MELFVLYLITIADSINIYAWFFGLICTFAGSFLSLMHTFDGDDFPENLKPFRRRFFTIGIVLLVFNMLLPNKDGLLLLAGGSLLLDVAKSEDARRISSNAVTLIDKMIGEELRKIEANSRKE